jgi:hypothetical protein
MCEYLYAAFSLRSTMGLGLRADQLAAALRWAASNLTAHIETAQRLTGLAGLLVDMDAESVARFSCGGRWCEAPSE